jgi:hypothetical protein
MRLSVMDYVLGVMDYVLGVIGYGLHSTPSHARSSSRHPAPALPLPSVHRGVDSMPSRSILWV